MSFQPGANVYTQGFGSRPEDVEVPHIDVRAPASTDVAPVGKRWIYKDHGEYVNVGNSSSSTGTTSTWALLGDSGGGALDTLTASSGGALTPSSNNINIFGTASQITTAGAGSTITLSLPNAITTPGSLTTTTTLAVGTNATVGGTLGVTGASTLAGLSATTGSFSSTLAVTGTSTLGALTQVGTANINATGAALTTIGAGTGAVHIGNTTGNTTVTGSLSTTTTLTGGTGITATTGNIVASAGNITTTVGSITSATSLTATNGNITATSGDLVLSAAGKKLRIHASATATDSAGTFVLGGGATTTVNCSAVTTNSLILLTCQALGTVLVPSALAVTAKSNGVSFDVTPSDATDTSTIAYLIIN